MMPKPPPYRPLISSVPTRSRAVAQLCEPSPRVAARDCSVNHLADCVHRGGSLGGLLPDEVPRSRRSRTGGQGLDMGRSVGTVDRGWDALAPAMASPSRRYRAWGLRLRERRWRLGAL